MSQFVSINGVTQGFISGPLLFIIFINDFPMSRDLFKFVLLADESTLTCSFNETDREHIILR